MALTELIPPLQKIILHASEEILDIYERSHQFEVQAKNDASPLTQADLLSNEMIIAGLQQLVPNYPVLSEEAEKTAYSERQLWQRYWLVDPLDGTLEFIRHSGEFVVNIALIDEHRPVLGMIYAPVHARGYYAVKGCGAFRWSGEQCQPIHTRRWQKDKTVFLTSRGMREERLRRYFGFLSSYEWHASGSAIKFCQIAEGLADCYPRFGDTCEWDTAAGQILLTEAGGMLVDFNWQPLRYNTKASLINPHFMAVGDPNFIKFVEREHIWQNKE